MNAKEKGTIAFVAPVLVMFIAAAGFAVKPKAPSHPVQARVVQMYTAGARFPRTIIVAQAQGAMEARGRVRDRNYDLCHIGDVVDGVQTGVALQVNPDSCRPPQMSSTNRP
jgi:hypothetical protein